MRIGSVSRSPSSHLPGSELRTSTLHPPVTPAPVARARRGHNSVRPHLRDEDFRRPERSLATAKRQQSRDGRQPSGLSCSAVAGNPDPHWFQSAHTGHPLQLRPRLHSGAGDAGRHQHWERNAPEVTRVASWLPGQTGRGAPPNPEGQEVKAGNPGAETGSV